MLDAIDPLSLSVISNIVTNCLVRTVRYLGGFDQNRVDIARESLHEVIGAATDELATSIDWQPPPSVEEVGVFILSPEVETTIRQIISVKILNESQHNDMQEIERGFISLFVNTFYEDGSELENTAKTLFHSIFEECENQLNKAIDLGILSAHEAKSSIRYQMLSDELHAMHNKLLLLSEPKTLDIKVVVEFEEKYRQQVSNRHGHITPPHFDSTRKIPINDLYVMPYFVKQTGKNDEDKYTLTGKEFIQNTYRSIVLGDPGSGKSTFAHKVCYDLSTTKMESCFCRKQLTPILVTLRDFGATKKTNSCSILQFIEGISNSIYQLAYPERAFEYLILESRVIVIFDGLDELLDTSYRKEISEDIESFCGLYPSVPILVTSRSVGYEQAPLNADKFEVFHINEFNNTQVSEYVTKWFEIEEDFTIEQRKQKVDAFLDESKIVPDLRSNPLMLALMCNIYRGENYIPKNRPDVYEKCATMLFERWDLSRDINVLLPFEAHVRPTMMHLAHWIYGDEKLQSGVTEGQLISETCKYLLIRRYEDEYEAKAAAIEFIGFCRGRAWVFTDVGLTKQGERIYQFTHRTFLEYFTAQYIYRTNSTATALHKILLPRIIKQEWDVVSQLSVQILNKNVEGAGDELLTMFLNKAMALDLNSKSKWALISFISRCLEFIVPSPRLTRQITRFSVEECLRLYELNTQREKIVRVHRLVDPDSIIGNLLNTATENITISLDEFINTIVKTATSDNNLKSAIAIEAALFVPLKQRQSQGKREISNEIIKKCGVIIDELRKKFYTIWLGSFIQGKGVITEIGDWYEIQEIFHRVTYLRGKNAGFASIAWIILSDIVYGKNIKRFSPEYDINRALKDLGHLFLKTPQPSINAKDDYLDSFFDFPLRLFMDDIDDSLVEVSKTNKIDQSSYFGLFVILAVYFEVTTRKTADSNIHSIIDYMGGLFNKMEIVFKIRSEQESDANLINAIKKFDFSNEEMDVLWKWSHRELHFVKK